MCAPRRVGRSFTHHTVTITVGLEGAYLATKIRGAAKVFDQFRESGNGVHLEAESLADILNGRVAVLAGLLFTVEGNSQRSGLSTGRLDDLDGFAHGRAGSDDIIDDDHPAGDFGTYDLPAFAVVFYLLAVKGKGYVAIMMLCECSGGRGSERDPLVGRAEQHEVLRFRRGQRGGVEAGQSSEQGAGVEEPGVEEIRADPARFEGKLAETQYPAVNGELQEFALAGRYGLLRHAGAGAGWIGMRIITLNVNGIRAAARKGFFDWLPGQEADIVCLQETRAQPEQRRDPMFAPPGYHVYYLDAERKGYSGVAVYSRMKPDRVIEGLGWNDFDCEGRALRIDLGRLSVISLYLPSGSSGDVRQDFKYDIMQRMKSLLTRFAGDGREYLICGDVNIAHKEIDLKNWRSNQKNSGFLPAERAWLDWLFDQAGFVDTFRGLDPSPEQYTWWSNRGQSWAKNVGWRIDYQIATPALAKRSRWASIYKDERFSDHAPLIIDYDIGARWLRARRATARIRNPD